MSSSAHRKREPRALALAAALHALLFWVTRGVVTSPGVDSSSAPSQPTASEVDVEWPAEPTREEQPPSPPSGSEAAAAPRAAEAAAAPRAAAQRGRTTAPEAVAELEASESSASSEEVTQSPNEESEAIASNPHVDLGLGADGWQRFVDSTANAKPAEPTRQGRELFRTPQRSTTGGLQEGLEAHDRKVSMSPSGRVRTALFDATHSDVAPTLGLARFHVTVLQNGSVEVSLGAFSDNREGWEAVAQRAAEELRKKPPRIPSVRKGARFVIEIKAEAVYPNGAKPKDMSGPHLEVVAPKFKATDETKAELEENNPVAGTPAAPQIKLNVELPGVYVAGRGKVCSYRIGMSALGPILQGGCDPSNIGAKQMRMVHTRVREESLF